MLLLLIALLGPAFTLFPYTTLFRSNFSQHPYLEVTIPSLTDPSLAPAGKHVMSIYVQYAPFKLRDGDWETRRDAFGNTVVKTLSEYAPDLPGLILDGQIITPKDLEDT